MKNNDVLYLALGVILALLILINAKLIYIMNALVMITK